MSHADPVWMGQLLQDGDDALPAFEVLSYDDLRQLCIAHFGYTQRCQDVFDMCVDKDRQFIPANELPRVAPGSFLIYFSPRPQQTAHDVATTLPPSRAGFLARCEVDAENVVLYMKSRLWKVKYHRPIWLVQLKPMQRLERELKSNTLTDDSAQ